MNRAYFNGLKVVAKQKDEELLLDLFPGAAAAFSLRKLRAAYTGAAIRVRRSSDDAEQDIGFDANNDLDTAALLAFVGSGDGFAVTMYDQSLNGFHHTNDVPAEQIQVVENGAVITTYLNVPNLRNNGGSAGFEREGSFLNNGEVSIFSITAVPVYEGGKVPMIFDAAQGANFGSNGSLRFDFFNADRLGTWNGSGNGDFILSSRTPANTPVLRTGIATNSGLQSFVNGVLADSDSKTGGVDFSRTTFTNFFGYKWVKDNVNTITGIMLVVYNNDQSANREAIESNINNYYNVF